MLLRISSLIFLNFLQPVKLYTFLVISKDLEAFKGSAKDFYFQPGFSPESGFAYPYSKPSRIQFQTYRKDVESEPIIFARNFSNADPTIADALEENTASTSKPIVFPDSKKGAELKAILLIEEEPKCAEGSTFCEEFENYPYNNLKSILEIDSRHKELFGIDEGPIEHRIGDPEDNFICPSVDRIIFPKLAKNKYNKWKYIINQGEQDGYVQGVRIETCIKPNGPCSLLDSTPHGYITSCRQKYIYRRLLSLSDGGRPLPDTFQMPSACCCSYKRDSGYLVNFGKDSSSLRSGKTQVHN